MNTMAIEETLTTIMPPIISSAVVILIFIITRARSQGDTTTTTSLNVQSVMKTLEERREEERERDKDLKQEMREMNNNINSLTNSLGLHTHMFNENKEMIAALKTNVGDIQNRLYVLELKLGTAAKEANKGAV